MMSVQAFAEDYITVWEDGGSHDPAHTLSLDPADAGNWTGGACGAGVCCGSQHGVTAEALARYRGCPPAEITEADMRALTLAEAAAIAVKTYYEGSGLAQLPWNQVTASAMDFAWNAGPREAAKLLQRLAGVTADGVIGPGTVAAYGRWLGDTGVEQAATLYAAQRKAFYQTVATARPTDARFLAGWLRRTAYYEPGTPWWSQFAAGV